MRCFIPEEADLGNFRPSRSYLIEGRSPRLQEVVGAQVSCRLTAKLPNLGVRLAAVVRPARKLH